MEEIAMLKKVLPSVLAAALLLSIGTTSAFAAGLGQGPYFVDANGDGICDYAGTGCSKNFVDADGDGVCDYAGTACPYRNADGNSNGVRPQGGAGWGNGCHRGRFR